MFLPPKLAACWLNLLLLSSSGGTHLAHRLAELAEEASGGDDPSSPSAAAEPGQMVADWRHSLDPWTLPAPGGRPMFVSPLWLPAAEQFVSFARLDLFPLTNETHLLIRRHYRNWTEVPGTSRSMAWPEGCERMVSSAGADIC